MGKLQCPHQQQGGQTINDKQYACQPNGRSVHDTAVVPCEDVLGCDMAGRRLAESGMHAEWKHCQHVGKFALHCTLVLHATSAAALSCFGMPRHRDSLPQAQFTCGSW